MKPTTLTSRMKSMKLEASEARERLREQYRPPSVTVLFVGESPPASGRFFYQANSGLYRAIQSAFIKAFPVLDHQDFLKQFQAAGCYLTDLCAKPVDRLDRNERMRVCREGEIRLAETIKHLQPEIIISVVRSISMNVTRALKRAEWVGRHFNLPYPGRWHRHQLEFEQALLPILRADVHLS